MCVNLLYDLVYAGKLEVPLVGHVISYTVIRGVVTTFLRVHKETFPQSVTPTLAQRSFKVFWTLN